MYFSYLQYQMSYYRICWYDSFNRRKSSELHRLTQIELTSSINLKKCSTILVCSEGQHERVPWNTFWWILLEIWTWSVISSFIFTSLSLMFYFSSFFSHLPMCCFISVDILHKNECLHTHIFLFFRYKFIKTCSDVFSAYGKTQWFNQWSWHYKFK